MIEKERVGVLSDAELATMLRAIQVIAIVGLSSDTWRPSYGVARYLQSQGYQIVPVNPNCTRVLGERGYPDLQSVPIAIDLVNIFRRSEFVQGHVDEAITAGAKAIWMQLGVRDDAAARKATEHGLQVVMNRCLMVEHRRLFG